MKKTTNKSKGNNTAEETRKTVDGYLSLGKAANMGFEDLFDLLADLRFKSPRLTVSDIINIERPPSDSPKKRLNPVDYFCIDCHHVCSSPDVILDDLFEVENDDNISCEDYNEEVKSVRFAHGCTCDPPEHAKTRYVPDTITPDDYTNPTGEIAKKDMQDRLQRETRLYPALKVLDDHFDELIYGFEIAVALAVRLNDKENAELYRQLALYTLSLKHENAEHICVKILESIKEAEEQKKENNEKTTKMV